MDATLPSVATGRFGVSAILVALAAFVALTVGHPNSGRGAWPAPPTGLNGVVAADSTVASEAGVAIMKAGGNAFDAAVATTLVLGVVHPQSSGIGGGGFAVTWHAEEGTARAFDFRETAPAAAHRDMYVGDDGKVVPGLSTAGGLAVAVPGELAGLWELHHRYGKLPWRKVVDPAVRLAARGFVVDRSLAFAIAFMAKALAGNPAMAALYLHPDGRPKAEGELVENRPLAKTLKLIAKKGRDGFYSGKVAEEMVRAVGETGGILTLEDLAGYEVKERAPVRGSYRGNEIYAMPPPSSGGIALVQTLAMLERHDLKALGLGSSRYYHLLAEALKHAMADRAHFLGDSDFADVPIEKMTSAAYTGVLARRIDGWTHPVDWYGGAAAALLPYPGDKVAPPTDSGTSHLAVIDAEGNVVTVNTTVNLFFGSRVIGGSSGVLLNDQMDDFSAQPGVPNFFGLVQSELNAIEPGKRPLSSMSPTVIVRDGKAVWAAGGAGGPKIITGTIQATLAHLDFGLDALAAVSVPRIHHQWLPAKLFYEEDIPADVLAALERMGHELTPIGLRYAIITAASIDPETGRRAAGSDPRKGGLGAAY